MKVYKIYDNGGKTFDRYTVVLPVVNANGLHDCLGLSDNCDSPQGFSQWSECTEGKHLGKLTTFWKLPIVVKNHIVGRI